MLIILALAVYGMRSLLGNLQHVYVHVLAWGRLFILGQGPDTLGQ